MVSSLSAGLSRVLQATPLLLPLMLLCAVSAHATPTENLGLRVVPAPGRIVIDGSYKDWDLSGGIFICDNVETQRNTFSVWLHAMYDADNLYILARWTDSTPLNNPGSVKGDQ